MFKVGIDLDCLLENQTFSWVVVNKPESNIKIHLYTERGDDLENRIRKLALYFPSLLKLDMFTKKEDCDFIVDTVDKPGDWFTIKEKIVRCMNEYRTVRRQ